MGKKSSMASGSNPSSSFQNPNKSQKKSKTSNPKHSESGSDLKPEDPKTSYRPASTKSPKLATASPPKSSKLATAAKKDEVVDEDSILILEKVIEFMSANGGKTPTETTIKLLFECVDSLLTKKSGTLSRLYYRIRNLKKKYFRIIGNKVDIDSSKLSVFVDLGAKIWGQVDDNNVKGNDDNGFMFDGAKNREMFPILFEQAKGIWEQSGYSIDDLKKGFEFINQSKCKDLQKKWLELVVEDMEIEVQKLKNDIEMRNMVSKMI